MFGQWQIPWEILALASTNHYRHVATCCSAAQRALPWDFTMFADDELVERIGPSMTGAQRPQSMDVMLRRFSHKACADARDKVFGILGLIQEPEAMKVVADYGKTTREVYLEVTKIIREQSLASLRYLAGSGIGCGERDYNLPSWVRNYGWQPMDPRLTWCERQRQALYELYNASRGVHARTEILSDTQLSVQVTMIGQIHSVSLPHAEQPFANTLPTIRSWARFNGTASLAASEVGNGLQARSFWRTVMADAKFDAVRGWTRLTEEDLTEHMREIAKVQLAETNGERQYLRDSIMKSMVVATYGRSFCMTEQGQIGICPPATMAGDHVCALAGANTVFVLRQTARANEYLLVGDAYLHGFMDGEALHVHDTLVSVHLK